MSDLELQQAYPEAFGGVPLRQVKNLTQYMKALVYGRPGAGKTHLAALASHVPAMSPVLYLAPDQTETDTLYNIGQDALVPEINKWDDLWKIHEELVKDLNNPDKIPFKTVVVDTGTETERMWMRDIMQDVLLRGRTTGGEVNIDVPGLREWGMSSSGMRRLIRAYRDLPVNFIVTAHEAEMRDNAGVTWYKPDFPGKLKNQAAGMFSCVWYLYTKAETALDGRRKVVISERRLLLTGFTEGFVCKTRVGTLPRVVEDPSMHTLFEAVTGRDSVTGEKRPVSNE